MPSKRKHSAPKRKETSQGKEAAEQGLMAKEQPRRLLNRLSNPASHFPFLNCIYLFFFRSAWLRAYLPRLFAPSRLGIPTCTCTTRYSSPWPPCCAARYHRHVRRRRRHAPTRSDISSYPQPSLPTSRPSSWACNPSRRPRPARAVCFAR